MPKIRYIDRRFSEDSKVLIDRANAIIFEYQEQGFDLTLRQLYYQFVARGLLENNQKNYKRLGDVINDARLAGLIDWDRIVDRTRELSRISSWESPEEIVKVCAQTFQLDPWKKQAYRIEVWIEKEALAGVFERICEELRVPHLSCRGYTSQSEMWRAGQRIRGYFRENKEVLILHFGDHDPSGMDMSRDIRDRLTMFLRGRIIDFQRLALNMDQVEEYSPPPNPAKLTDSRSTIYIDTYGDDSWELDALEPQVLADLVRNAILAVRDETLWEESVQEEEEARRKLQAVSDRWNRLTRNL